MGAGSPKGRGNFGCCPAHWKAKDFVGLGKRVHPAITAEPIEMPFGGLTNVGQRHHVFDGMNIGQIHSLWRGVTSRRRSLLPHYFGHLLLFLRTILPCAVWQWWLCSIHLYIKASPVPRVIMQMNSATTITTNTDRPTTVHNACCTIHHTKTVLKKLEEASTHKSAKTHAGNVFATRGLDLWHLDFKIYEFPGLIVEHFCVTFGGPRCIGVWDIVRKKTDRQTTKVKTLPPRLPSAWVGNT